MNLIDEVLKSYGMVIQVGKSNVFKLKEQEKNKTLAKTL